MQEITLSGIAKRRLFAVQTAILKTQLQATNIVWIVRAAQFFKNIEISSYLREAKGDPGVAGQGEVIHIVQINLHHCSDATDAVVNYVISNKIDAIMCQDPYVVEGVLRGFSFRLA